MSRVSTPTAKKPTATGAGCSVLRVEGRRSHSLFLTNEGRMALAKIKGQAARHEKQVIELLGEARRQKLMKLLKSCPRDANRMRFMEDGFDGLLREQDAALPHPSRSVTRWPRARRSPVEATHWTSAMMMRRPRVSASVPSNASDGAMSPAAPGAPVQALKRSEVRRQAARLPSVSTLIRLPMRSAAASLISHTCSPRNPATTIMTTTTPMI
jgi:hypothetical protein